MSLSLFADILASRANKKYVKELCFAGRRFWKTEQFVGLLVASFFFYYLWTTFILDVLHYPLKYLADIGSAGISFADSFSAGIFPDFWRLLVAAYQMLVTLLYFVGGSGLMIVWTGLWLVLISISVWLFLLFVLYAARFVLLLKKIMKLIILNDIKELASSGFSDALHCPICFCPYHATKAEKQPYSANCGHTFCYSCWTKRTEDKCYMCRKLIGGNDHLIKNLGLIQVIESMG